MNDLRMFHPDFNVLRIKELSDLWVERARLWHEHTAPVSSKHEAEVDNSKPIKNVEAQWQALRAQQFIDSAKKRGDTLSFVEAFSRADGDMKRSTHFNA